MRHAGRTARHGIAPGTLLLSRWVQLASLAAAWLATGLLCPAQPLTSLHAIHQLTNTEAKAGYPVDFQATVTYARPFDRTLFVQDGDTPIFVEWGDSTLAPGDRVEIRGATMPGFRPSVLARSIAVVGHSPLPTPTPATFDQMIRAELDARYVSVVGVVRDAVSVSDTGGPLTQLQLHTDSGEMSVLVSADFPDALVTLLDATVTVTGVESGTFDGKMQQTGVELLLNTLDGIKLLHGAPVDPWSLPVTPMNEIASAYHVNNLSRRLRVHGTLTYYRPGAAAVIQDGAKSLWISTTANGPLRIGDAIDATGFPDVRDNALALTSAVLRDRNAFNPVQPQQLKWEDLSTGKHVYDLVALEGTVVAALRTEAQDEYVLEAGGNLFSAIYSHPALVRGGAAAPPLKRLEPGARVRVAGVCVMNAAGVLDAHTTFHILLRSPDDLVMLAGAPMITVANLIRVVVVLLLGILVFAVWGWMLRRRVRQQTEAITARSEADAAQERRIAQLEQWRSRILEDINSTRQLSDIVEHITEMVSFILNGAPCWCDVNDGPRLGRPPARKEGLRIISRDVPSRSGLVLATLYAALGNPTPNEEEESEALAAGVRLATLSIETRKLYSDLLHRSEFDLLTDMHNRFSLDRKLRELIERSEANGASFGLIYVDLDDFKLVNDLYGHHIGDLYLQEVSLRMKRQLRTGDMLGRLGGDEFAALVSVARGSADVEEIAQRLERCFDAPFALNGQVLRGSASVGMAIYPADGTTSDSLLSAADAAMYKAKNNRRAAGTLGSRSSR